MRTYLRHVMIEQGTYKNAFCNTMCNSSIAQSRGNLNVVFLLDGNELR